MRLRLELTRRKAFLLLTAFFISWRPGCLGSEQLTMTTYYPAPYGGYASLLTTGQTLLARDGGNVGIGTPAPGAKLDVAGRVKITGGAPGAGKVLTSDAAGLASWEKAAGGGAAISLKCGYYSGGACTPPSCRPGWTDSGTGTSYNGAGSAYWIGYTERWCCR